MEKNETNSYVEELKKFMKKQVVVKAHDGEVFVGECRGINFQHLSLVLMTDKEKIVVKNVQSIRRQRKY